MYSITSYQGNSNYDHNEVSLFTLCWLKLEITTTHIWQVYESTGTHISFEDA